MPGSGLMCSVMERVSSLSLSLDLRSDGCSPGKDPGPPLRHTSHHLRSHPLHRGIEERLLGYRGRMALIEVLDFQPAPDLGVLGRNPGIRDALPERVPEVRAGYVPDRPAIREYRLVSHHDHVGIVEQRADQLAARSSLLAFRQRLAPDEVSFIRLH